MMMSGRLQHALISGLLLFALSSANAVDVLVTDVDHPSGTTCQNMSSLSITQQAVNIAFPGSCIGTAVAGQSIAVNQTMSVTGGSTANKDVSTGATVTLPFESTAATITTQGTKGSATVNTGTTTVTYYANPTTIATTDAFYYRLNDSTTANTNVARVDVSIAAGGGGGGSSCVPSSSIICKGTLTLASGTLTPTPGLGDTLDHNHWKLQPSTTQVWQLNYSGGSYQVTVDQFSTNKKIKISTSSADMSVDTTGCYSSFNNIMYITPDTGTINNTNCELHVGTTYFFNLQTTTTSEDQYLIFVQ